MSTFRVIRAEERTASLIEWFSGICQTVTDFIVGSKIRSQFETVAVEMEAMDFAWLQSLTKAIPTAVYQAFNFTIRPATKATGNVTFTANPVSVTDILIPKGYTIATVGTATQPEVIFEVASSVTLTAGDSSIAVPVICTVAGVVGNVGSGTITVVKQSVNGITSISNAAVITGGLAQETEPERRVRFQEFIIALRRGTAGAIEAGAKTAVLTDGDGNITEQVMDSLVVERSYSVGTIDCYVYNGTGSTSVELVAEAQKLVDGYVEADGTKVAGYKAAGIVCYVHPATEIAQAVTLSVVATAGTSTATLQASIESVIASYLNSLVIGQPCLRNEIIERVMSTAGVYNCTLTIPATDITPATGNVITSLGVITVTVT